jgi:hypothetical protein
MEWLAGIVFGLGVLTWSMRQINARHGRRVKTSRKQSVSSQARQVKNVPQKGDQTMLADLNQIDDPLERHRIYTQIMEQAFHDRNSGTARELLLEMGRYYQAEFDRLLPYLRDENGPEPEILPLKWLAMALEEDGRYEEALTICRRAEDWKVSDGTKTGFAGRRQRIARKREKEAHKG